LPRLLAEGKSLKFVQQAGGWASIQIVAETYGHLEQTHLEGALRETGDGLITKLGSAPFLLPKPEIPRHKIGTNEDGGDLIEALRERHASDSAGENVVGARGIEPLTPSMSRLT